MRIARVRIQNFRCFSMAGGWAVDWLPNRDLNLLIGPNGSGKTALVDAIDLVLNWEGQTNRALVTEYDFPSCDTKKAIKIEITLVDIATATGRFEDHIQFLDKDTLEAIDASDETADDEKHKRGIIIRFEASFDREEGEIRWKWVLPKFAETDYQDEKELSRSQHEAIGCFRIQPSISAGAFTLSEYSTLGRHLRRLKYKLGRLPDQLKPSQTLPECKWTCDNCPAKVACTNESEDDETETKARPLGDTLQAVTQSARNMLGKHAWIDMEPSLGPRYAGLRTSLAAITLGLRPSEAEASAFIPFERLSTGEKYALSLSLATMRLRRSNAPIVIVEEPETALYAGAIGQIMAKLRATNPLQVIVTSHSESVIRRFALDDIFLMNSERNPVRLRKDVGHADRLGAEALVAPGRTSALLAEKVIVAEGLEDTIVSRDIDRLASEVFGPEKGFAASNWCFFDAGGAPNAQSKAKLLRNWGKSVAILFDGDAAGKEHAEETREEFPTFAYRSSENKAPALETALLNGLPEALRQKAEKAFRDNSRCKECDAVPNDIRDCLIRKNCASKVQRRERKRRLCSCCIAQYRTTRQFPRAFALLLDKLDGATPGDVIMLDVDYEKG